MSAVSTATRFTKVIVKAPVKALRKMRDNPVKTGLAFLAADIATKLPIRKLYEAGIKIDTCTGNSSAICFKTHFNAEGGFANDSITQLLFGLGTASLAYLFAKTNSQTVKLGIAWLISCAVGNLGEAVLYGNNVDIINMKSWSWPIYNIADIANFFGFWAISLDCGNIKGIDNLQEIPSRWQTIKSSFSRKNIWNTIQQYYLYAITIKFVIGGIFRPPFMPIYFLLSLIRDITHRGERRMFK
jgi:lipoprotein signal peptidase